MVALEEARTGHYGLPAWIVAGAGLLALVLHLAVPYAHVDPSDPDAESETLTRSEAADAHDGYDMAGLSSPGVTLAGAIVLLVAGLGLAAAGLAPLSVTAARWAGWGLAALATVGGLLAFASSLLWVGSGLGQYPYGSVTVGPPGGAGGFPFGGAFPDLTVAFGGLTGGLTGLLELALGTDNAGTVWVIGPVLTAALSATALLAALRVAAGVVSPRDGYRERAARHLAGARWALAFLAVALLVPWSIGKLEDYGGQGDQDYFLFGAHTVLNADNASGGALFGSLAYAMGVFAAAGFVGVLLGLLGSLGGVLASERMQPGLARATHFVAFGNLFMLLYAGILYVLAWIYMWRPDGDLDGFQPGYAPALALLPLAMWGATQVRLLRRLKGAPRLPALRAAEAVSFDR